MNPKKINKKLYDWLGVLKTTKERFLHTMRGSDTQDSFLNKLLDLYDKMIGSKILNKIENKRKKMKERKIREVEENKIIDIFKGDFIQVWRDDTFFYFSTPYAILNFTEEDWIEFKKDIDKLGDI